MRISSLKRIAVLLLLLSACGATIVSSWKKPGIERIDFRRVAVIAAFSDAATRRNIEDRLVAEIGRGRAVASYTLQPGPIEREVLKARLEESGIDGAIAIRIVDVDRETRWVPGTYSGAYGYGYGYYGLGFGFWPMYDPGYYTTVTRVQVETSMYEVEGEELLFSATSETVNPKSTRALVDATLKAVRRELEKEGVMPTPMAQASHQRATQR